MNMQLTKRNTCKKNGERVRKSDRGLTPSEGRAGGRMPERAGEQPNEACPGHQGVKLRYVIREFLILRKEPALVSQLVSYITLHLPVALL